MATRNTKSKKTETENVVTEQLREKTHESHLM